MEIFSNTTGRTSNLAPFPLHSVCLAILEGKQFKSQISCQLMSHKTKIENLNPRRKKKKLQNLAMTYKQILL